VDTVQEAMKYSDNSHANMSSTIVFDPLKAVLQAPAAKGYNVNSAHLPLQQFSNTRSVPQGEVIPRVVFLLTDGQFSDRDKILDLVNEHVHQSSVYTIGLGDDVYEEDLKIIAQHGNGQALIVKNATSLQARIIDMLQSKFISTHASLCKYFMNYRWTYCCTLLLRIGVRQVSCSDLHP
jgi:hypothetical protein